MNNSSAKIIIGLLAICATLVTLEITLGNQLKNDHLEELRASENWATAFNSSPNNELMIPIKGDTSRIVYISNSHAKTGGHVARHLQELLNRSCSKPIEVLDLAAAGIFAPDMLQRALTSLEFSPDLMIVSPAYISFSDHMPLSRQAHSARNFLQPAVFSRLPISFWANNYELGLYLNTMISSISNLYRYRNQVRDIWEIPITNRLKSWSPHPVIRSLEQDENQRWRFPAGFDANLFQWELYSHGRAAHMDDFSSLVNIITKQRIPLVVANLPIHWEKENNPIDSTDIEKYRRSIQRLSQSADLFLDYQSSFPVSFTTYDALHPTWHGARMHALNYVLHLWPHIGSMCGNNLQTIAQTFRTMGQEQLAQYKQTVSPNYLSDKASGFRRYDITEAANAKSLLERLNLATVGSEQEQQLLIQFAARKRFWFETQFSSRGSFSGTKQDIWASAFKDELEANKKAIEHFIRAVIVIQTEKLADYPTMLPEAFPPSPSAIVNTLIPLNIYNFELNGGRRLRFLQKRADKKPVAAAISGDKTKNYERYDIFLDGSFIAIRPFNESYPAENLPDIQELTREKPFVAFGI